MDHIDLEAATENTTKDNAILGERNSDLHQVSGFSSDEPRVLDTHQDVRLYRFAREIIEEVLQALPKLLQQQRRSSNDSFELLDMGSVEEPTVAGEKENNQRRWQYRKSNALHEVSKTALDHSSQAGDEPLMSTNYASLEQYPDVPSQQPKRTDTAKTSYKSRVEPMTREVIEAEKERRKEIRQKWKGTGNLEHIEDPWKELFRWPCPDEERRELQAELADALSSAPMRRRDKFIARGHRAMACWISLIGLRLKDLYELHGFPGPAGTPDMPSNLCGGLGELDRAQRAYEIFRTRSLLLTSHGKRAESEIIQHYGSLKAPPWLRLLANHKLETWNNEEEPIEPEDARRLSDFLVGANPVISEFCLEIEDHVDQRWPPDGQEELDERIMLSDYPFYCERLRELRFYMDSQ
ncbi:MAG: hypothetical protein Q9182_006872 [Xanthomendoza sp. 2 TL-2023]